MLKRSYRKLIMTECPACGADLSDMKHKADHFADEHLPEDFGLSPLGEVRGEVETR